MSDRRCCENCQRQLSRYNSEPVCSACARSGGPDPRPSMCSWDSAELRQALAKVDLGRVLAIIRNTAGLSQLELASLLGWSQSGVARIESGQRDTLYDIRRLFEVTDALGMPRLSLMPLLTQELAEPTIEGNERDRVSLNRREFGGAVIGLAAVAGLGQARLPARVDSVHVRYLRASAVRLYAQDQILGGGALTREGLSLYYQARRMLDESDYDDATARQLISAAGDLAVCVGWLCYDANDQALASTLYSEARLLADQSGDQGLSVRAMEKMSLQLVAVTREENRTGPAREAVRLSRRAVELARNDPCPELHALLAAREAIVHAAVGDRDEFNIAMTRAWREMDRRTSHDKSAWLQFVNMSEIGVHEAKGRSYLGDPGSAAKLYRRSLEANLSMRNNANYRAQMAAALAASGDLPAAVAEGMAVLPQFNDRTVISPRTISELKTVREGAAHHRSFSIFCAQYDQAMKISHDHST